MVNQNWMQLQLFAQGAEASGTGENAADAGQEDNQEIRERTEQDGQDTGKKSLRALLEENPQYNQEIQAIIRARLKEQKNAREQLDSMAPLVEALAKRFGQDPRRPDYGALAQAVQGGDYSGHFRELERQGEAMKTVFPQFDLRQELRNPAFARMTHPGVGISVEDAFYAVHRGALQAAAMEAAAQNTARKLASAIAAGSLRPVEAGQASQAASVTRFDYRSASREQREALRQRIREAAARGEKVFP